MESFLNAVDLSHVSNWKRAHRESRQNSEGDWVNFLSVSRPVRFVTANLASSRLPFGARGKIFTNDSPVAGHYAPHNLNNSHQRQSTVKRKGVDHAGKP